MLARPPPRLRRGDHTTPLKGNAVKLHISLPRHPRPVPAHLQTGAVTGNGTVLADYGMRVTEAGSSRTVISLSKPDGWPQGTHSIEIAINGQAERTVTFEVQ